MSRRVWRFSTLSFFVMLWGFNVSGLCFIATGEWPWELL